MKKIFLSIGMAAALAACGSESSDSNKSGSLNTGDKTVWKCPGENQNFSLVFVKDDAYSAMQGMASACLTRADKDGYQNYNPQPGYPNLLGFQINPKGEAFIVRWGKPIGPCELVEKASGGYANPQCAPKK